MSEAERDEAIERIRSRDDIKFFEAAQAVLGDCDMGCIRDDYGGEVFYVYREPQLNSNKHAEAYAKQHFTEEELQIAETLLPAARRKYFGGVKKRLKQALQDFALETLSPVYQALGKRYVGWEIDRWRRTSKAVEVTLEDGFVIRRKVKKDLPFTPGEEWPKERLEAALRNVAFFFIRNPQQVTLRKVAAAINRFWAPGEALNEDSLQKLLERRGIDWNQRKKEMVEQIKNREEKLKTDKG